MGRRTHLRLARSKPTSGKGLRENTRKLNRMALHGLGSAYDTTTRKPLNCIENITSRTLRGVASTKLHSMAAVAPVLQLNKSDSRFIANVDVASTLEARVNLATISWQDFEYLIREIFEKELSPLGGEVRVTQASRDGGVDAIAFDPDPIWGGKIVIQAKRYTNTVGVAAVRDLFGTVHNEGANKGILVTTSNYGPDARQFAQGKPITLINGAELLHLLSKHGHSARIDLAEAKRINSENIAAVGDRPSKS